MINKKGCERPQPIGVLSAFTVHRVDGRTEARVHDDDEGAFAEFAAAELPGLRRFAYALCSDWHRADDLVQGALERMYVVWPRVHRTSAPGSYLRTVVARLAVSESRRPWRREYSTEKVPDNAAPDGSAAAVDRLDLARALAGLTIKQRAVVVLRYVEDRSVADVASILGIAEGTVKRQCHDALGRLRHSLESASPTTQPVRVADEEAPA